MNARNIPSFHILPDVVLAFQITKVKGYGKAEKVLFMKICLKQIDFIEKTQFSSKTS